MTRRREGPIFRRFVDRQTKRIPRHQERTVALTAFHDRRHCEHNEHFGQRPVAHPGLLAEDAVPVSIFLGSGGQQLGMRADAWLGNRH